MLKRRSTTQIALFILILLYLVVAIFFTSVLNYDFFRSDVKSYWVQSVDWKMPYNEHVPFYTLLIAFFRAVTFNLFQPVILMMAINILALSLCIIFFIQLFRLLGINQNYSLIGVLLFGLWPFVGLTYTVVPIADMPAICLTVIGLVFLQKMDYKIAALFLGLAIITHKGVWPIIGLLTIADFWKRKEYFSKKNIQFVAIMVSPLFILWFAGTFYHQSVTWLMERSLEVNTSFSNNNQILDGLFGSFQKGGLKGFVKGSIVLIIMALDILLIFIHLKYKFKNYVLGLAILIAVLIMFIFSSSGTVWGPVRFSKFLVIPLMISIYALYGKERKSFSYNKLLILFGISLLLSQFAYAWYIAKVFYT